MKRLTASLLSRFRTSERGAILVEALIAIPFVTIFAVGLLEFGTLFWERQQMQAGVRDAARYWSRCSAASSTAGACSINTARNIAFFGTPTAPGTIPTSDTDPCPAGVRVSNWCRVADLSVTVTPPASVPQSVPDMTVVSVSGRLLYKNSPMFALLDIAPLTVRYNYSMRYLGW